MLRRIVSGGQTGVDRAALDAAISLGIPVGGWCPRGRRAEDGVLPERYPLRETASSEYAERTVRNVRDADATLILAAGELRGGTALTRRVARQHNKPYLVVDPSAADPATVRRWLTARGVRVLNVAGPREGSAPGTYAAALAFMKRVLTLSVGRGL